MKKMLLIAAVVWGLCGFGVEKIVCDTLEKGHVQGIAGSENAWYWVFTGVIIKTDLQGKILLRKELHRETGHRVHGGSPCFVGGRLFVPYCGGSFNRDLKGKTGHNYIQEYDENLNFIKSYPAEEVKYGVGCIAYLNGHFFVSGGRPANIPGNTVWEYDRNFKFVRTHELAFSSKKGIQTLVTDGEKWYFGVYKASPATFVADKDFKMLGAYRFNGAVGHIPVGEGKFLRVLSTKKKDGGKQLRGAALLPVKPDFLSMSALSR